MLMELKSEEKIYFAISYFILLIKDPVPTAKKQIIWNRIIFCIKLYKIK